MCDAHSTLLLMYYLLLLGVLVFAAASSVQAAEYRFYHPDPLGSNVVVTDRSGRVVQRTVSTPYGEMRSVLDGEGNSIEPGANSPRHLFTDQEHDPESGLHYFNARYYDSFVGKFLSVDPDLTDAFPGVSFSMLTSEPGNFNTHAYVRNRPTHLIDPTGTNAIRLGESLDDDPGIVEFSGFFSPEDLERLNGPADEGEGRDGDRPESGVLLPGSTGPQEPTGEGDGPDIIGEGSGEIIERQVPWNGIEWLSENFPVMFPPSTVYIVGGIEHRSLPVQAPPPSPSPPPPDGPITVIENPRFKDLEERPTADTLEGVRKLRTGKRGFVRTRKDPRTPRQELRQ